MVTRFKRKTEGYCLRVRNALSGWLLVEDGSDIIAPRLIEAMRYSVLNGGKRVRPVLAYAAAEAIGESNEGNDNGPESLLVIDTAAAAVECIHAYSLIHDDLPAMDDDNLRRGQPTCHIKFDEATAILAGDALQALAFEKLAELDDASLALKLIKELAIASGANGMVGGQMLDLQAEGQSQHIQIDKLECIHRHKTGAIIRASVRMGAIAAGANQQELAALTTYAEALGLAFQVQDDIIDVCSDTQTLGKPQGADSALDKSTYVSLLGLSEAKNKAQHLVAEAKEALAPLPIHHEFLLQLADYVIKRQS